MDASDHHRKLGSWRKTVSSYWSEKKTSVGRKPLSIVTIAPILGLSYFAAFALGLILRSLISVGALASYQIFFIPPATLATICAVTVWWKPRAGYIAAAMMSIALMAIFFLTRDGNVMR